LQEAVSVRQPQAEKLNMTVDIISTLRKKVEKSLGGIAFSLGRRTKKNSLSVDRII